MIEDEMTETIPVAAPENPLDLPLDLPAKLPRGETAIGALRVRTGKERKTAR